MERKIEGGKLVRVKVDYGYIINQIEISGDFFLHPEESLEKIEDALLNIHPNDSLDEISKRIENVVEKYNIKMIGITPKALAEVVKETFLRLE